MSAKEQYMVRTSSGRMVKVLANSKNEAAELIASWAQETVREVRAAAITMPNLPKPVSPDTIPTVPNVPKVEPVAEKRQPEVNGRYSFINR